MAAPSNAYRSNKIIVTGTSIPTVYNSIAVPNANTEELKQRFFLDQILPVETPEGSGFIGLCMVDGLNYQRHNINRIGAIRANIDGGTYAAYVDAGLNTTGNAQILDFYVAYRNWIRVRFSFTSSYFEETTEYGYEIRQGNNQWYKVVLGNYIAPNEVLEFDFNIETEQEAGITQLRPYINNTEGTHTYVYYPITAEWLHFVPIYKRTSPCVTYGATLVNAFILASTFDQLNIVGESDESSNLYIYADDTLNTVLPTGWYQNLDFSGANKIYYIQDGEFRYYTTCAVGPRYINVSGTISPNGVYVLVQESTGTNLSQDVEITGYIQAYNGSTPVGTPEYFYITLPASTYIVSPLVPFPTVEYYNYKFTGLTCTPNSDAGQPISITDAGIFRE